MVFRLGHFFQTLFQSFSLPKKIETVKKREKSTFILYCNILLHIIAVSIVGEHEQVTEHDYVWVMCVFALVSLVTTAAALLSLTMSLYVFQLVMQALNAGNIVGFQLLLALFATGSFLSYSIDFFSKSFGAYVRESMVYQVRVHFEQLYVEQKGEIDINENQRAFFDSIDRVIAHIPVIIKLAVLVMSVGVYVFLNFNVFLLVTSAIMGIIIKFVNRYATSWLERVNSEEKAFDQKARIDRLQMYQNRQSYIGINALGAQFVKMKAYSYQLYQLKFKLSVFKYCQEMVAKMIKVLSSVLYYLYFSSVLFLGYMTLAEVFILMPFVEEIGETAAKMIALPLMMMTIKTDVSNLLFVWNQLVPSKHKIRSDFQLLKLSKEKILRYTVITVGVLLSIYWCSSIQIIKAISLVLTLLPLNAYIYPNSTSAQLFFYIMKMAEYPFSYSPIKIKNKIKQLTAEQSVKSVFFNPYGQPYAIDKSVFKDNLPVQVIADSGAGKTVVFGGCCPGKIPLAEQYYTSDDSMHITANMALLPTYSDAVNQLADTLFVDTEELFKYLENTLKSLEYSEIITYLHKPLNEASTGQAQLLYVLSCFYKAMSKQYKYLCIDEALSGLSNNQPVYSYVAKKCQDHNIQLVVIDHQRDAQIIDGMRQVRTIIDEQDTTVFTASPLSVS